MTPLGNRVLEVMAATGHDMTAQEVADTLGVSTRSMIFVAWCWCASWWAAEEKYDGDGSEFDTWDDEYDYDDHLREYARDDLDYHDGLRHA